MPDVYLKHVIHFISDCSGSPSIVFCIHHPHSPLYLLIKWFLKTMFYLLYSSCQFNYYSLWFSYNLLGALIVRPTQGHLNIFEILNISFNLSYLYFYYICKVFKPWTDLVLVSIYQDIQLPHIIHHHTQQPQPHSRKYQDWSKNFCTCGGWKDKVWVNFTVKWNARWNNKILFLSNSVCISLVILSITLIRTL